MKRFLKRAAKNAMSSPKTTIGGILAIIGLFTPVSPAIVAGAAAAGLIFGAADGKDDDKAKAPK